MNLSIAVAGKGGTGKSTLAALLIEVLRRKKSGPILAVDADPNSTLDILLGIKKGKTVSDIIEETKGLQNLPAGVSKSVHLQYLLQQIIVESQGVDLLVMGHPEGRDCYCLTNTILRGYVDEIAKNYKYIILDNEAGMEHLNRRTTQDIDILLVVSEPTKIGLRTARRIKGLIDKLTFLKIKSKYLVLNRVQSNIAELDQQIKDTGLPLIGTLPFTPDLLDLDLLEKPLSSLPDNSSLIKICDEMLGKISKR